MKVYPARFEELRPHIAERKCKYAVPRAGTKVLLLSGHRDGHAERRSATKFQMITTGKDRSAPDPVHSSPAPVTGYSNATPSGSFSANHFSAASSRTPSDGRRRQLPRN